CDSQAALSDYLCARSSPDPTTRSLPAPTNPASAHGSSPVQIPPTPDNKLPLTLPSLCVSLSSAYPFSACSNRQPFVSKSTKGYAYLFPVSTLFDYSSIFVRRTLNSIHCDNHGSIVNNS